MKNQFIALMMMLSILPVVAGAQRNPYVDSLKKALTISKNEEKFNIYYKLANTYRMNSAYDVAAKMAEAYKLAAESEKNQVEQVKAYSVLMHIQLNLSDFKKAQLYMDSVEWAGGDGKNLVCRNYVNYAKAIFYYALDNSEMVVKYCQEILKEAEPDNKDQFLQGRCYYYLYTVYTNYNDFEKSFYYAKKTAMIAGEIADMELLSSACSALGVVYTYRYDREKNKYDLDSVIYYTRQAGDIYFTHPGKISYETYALARLNLSSYYLRYYFDRNPAMGIVVTDTVQALLNTSRAKGLKINEDVEASCYGMLGRIAKAGGDFAAADSYFAKGMTVLDSARLPYYYTHNNLLTDQSDLYAQKGDYKKAYELQKKLVENNAKLFDEDQALIVNKLEAQYQAKKKEQEVQVLKEQARSRQKAQNLYLGLAGIGLVGVFFMFRSYYFNLKFSQEAQKKLEAEQHEAQTLIRLQNEEQARLKAEQELLELQQQQLRDEVMIRQLQVQHKNEVLQTLKEKLQVEDPVNIQQIIREENILDADFEKAKFSIQEVHPNFFKQLNEKAQQKLTSLDQKYCAYWYLGMDTKQIASLLNVEPKSVRMTKYRLKQKFGLERATNLETFLKEMN